MSNTPIHLPLRQPALHARFASVLQHTALVAASFSMVVAILIGYEFVLDHAQNPLTTSQVTDLKAQLNERPGDQQLKEQIRIADLRIRQNFFTRRRFIASSALMIAAGLVTVVVCLKAARRATERLPDPAVDFPERTDPWRKGAWARGSIATLAVLMGATMAVLAAMPTTVFVEPKTAEVAATPLPTDEQFMANWPSFRGPEGNGIVKGTGFPATWDGASGQNILWKAPIPLAGANSPIIWDDRVLVSAADKADSQRQVLCFDINTGKLLWTQSIAKASTGASPPVHDETGRAPSTLATDGLRVYSIWTNGDVAAVDLKTGKRLWVVNLGTATSLYGYATSLAVADGRPIIQYDIGEESGKSAMIALDGASGKVAWKTPRPVPNSWASPTIARTPAGKMIFTAADPWVIAYDAQTGSELWRAECLRGDVAPSPVYSAGKVYVANDRAKLSAIKVDGSGNVTDTHIAWSAEEGMPDIVSPLATEKYALLITTSGLLTCYNAEDGSKAWEHELGAVCNASPLLFGNDVYLTDQDGVTHVFALGKDYNESAKLLLGEKVHATPAAVNGRIYIRGTEHLYCIGTK